MHFKKWNAYLWAFHCSKCPHDGPNFFLFGGAEGGGFFFGWLFSLILNVPNMFPAGSPSSQVVPEFIPYSTSILSHMVCPKFNPHVYKLKRSAIGEYICLNFEIGSPKKCFHWGVLNVPNFLLMGQWIWLFPKKNKKTKNKSYEHTHELINMNHTRLEGLYGMNYY
jgi:hypothetical protein